MMRKKRFTLLVIASFLAVMNVYAGAPKGSFELNATMPAITMVNVVENGSCAGRNGDIGMDSNGLILSCQSGSWESNTSSSSCYVAQNSNSSRGTVTVSCAARYQATGGGCITNSPGSDNMAMTYPIGNPATGWACLHNDNGGTVSAICCQ